MAKRAKRQVDEDEGSGYSWMDTYGDMVTLLLCFFVLLYSFCSVDAGKWKQLVEAFTGSSSSIAIDAMDMAAVRAPAIYEVEELGGHKESDTEEDLYSMGDSDSPEQGAMMDLETNQDEFDMLYHSLKSYVEENDLTDDIYISKDGDTILIRFVEIILFESGKADLLPTGRATLVNIMGLLDTYEEIIKGIVIEGHTDNVPINTTEFANNWELSIARAKNTLYLFLEEDKIALTKLSVKGYGEYQPIDDNDTEEGRARNRRVDFVVERIDQ